jgi:hypothetical protein
VHTADRKHGVSQLLLVEHMHDVALVFVGVVAPQQCVGAVVGPTDVCVVARRNRIEAEEVGALGEARKLDRSIALDARVRCRAVGVSCHVRVNDVLVEIFTEVEHKMINAELLRNSTSVIDI